MRLSPLLVPSWDWTPSRTLRYRLCAWDKSGEGVLQQKTPTVTNGSPSQSVLGARLNRLPPKATGSTVHLKKVVELSAVVCAFVSPRNKHGY